MTIALEQVQNALTANGLTGWLFCDHHRRDPIAYRLLRLPEDLHPTRRWFYLIPNAGSPKALLHRIEPNALDGLPGSRRLYSNSTELLAEMSILLDRQKSLCMQYSPRAQIPSVSLVDAGTVEFVRDFVPNIFSSADLVQAFEATWTDEQLQSHMDAARSMDDIRRTVFKHVSDRLRSGSPVSEWSVRNYLREAFESRNLVADHGPIVAVNANASNPHYEPTSDRHSLIKKGDLLLIDMWAKLRTPGSVFYDITWTGFFGETTPDEMQTIFSIVKDARDAAIDIVRSSLISGKDLRGFQVDDAARSVIRSAGYAEFFIHRTGHSIGTDVHGAGANMDNLETHDTRRIIPRTCFSVEPGVYLPAFGIRSEVNVYVTDDKRATVTGEVQTTLSPLL